MRWIRLNNKTYFLIGIGRKILFIGFFILFNVPIYYRETTPAHGNNFLVNLIHLNATEVLILQKSPPFAGGWVITSTAGGIIVIILGGKENRCYESGGVPIKWLKRPKEVSNE